MSRVNTNKITYDKKSETVTCDMGYGDPYVITADKVTDAPAFCESDHSKVIYQLFYDLHNRIKMTPKVSAKFQDAELMARMTRYVNQLEVMDDKCFIAFLNVIDNGSKAFTKGEYIVEIQYSGFVAYHKNAKGATRDKASAKVFKTLEHAKWEAIQRQGKVVAL